MIFFIPAIETVNWPQFIALSGTMTLQESEYTTMPNQYSNCLLKIQQKGNLMNDGILMRYRTGPKFLFLSTDRDNKIFEKGASPHLIFDVVAHIDLKMQGHAPYRSF